MFPVRNALVIRVGFGFGAGKIYAYCFWYVFKFV